MVEDSNKRTPTANFLLCYFEWTASCKELKTTFKTIFSVFTTFIQPYPTKRVPVINFKKLRRPILTVQLISLHLYHFFSVFNLKVLTIAKRGGLSVESFDWSPFKLFSLKFSNKLVQAPSCQRHKTAPRTLFILFANYNCCPITLYVVSGCDTLFTSYT